MPIKNPKVSIAIPIHKMMNFDFFLDRCLASIREQSFQDYELVITENPNGMAANTNEAIKRSTGDLIKILYMDDYFADKHALQRIVDAFKGNWMATGCEHDNGKRCNPHKASFDGIPNGQNTIGSPSVITIKNGLDVYFDEKMTWLLDVDFYKRLNEKFGPPEILDDINVVIGVGDHQMTHILSDELKANEEQYLKQKYA